MSVFGICTEHFEIYKIGDFDSPEGLNAWLETNPETIPSKDLILTEYALLELAKKCIEAFNEDTKDICAHVPEHSDCHA